jgi:2,4-dienoyl-CoA reductase-like NADH-dependent reductase (Old Yellow Enzyme family)
MHSGRQTSSRETGAPIIAASRQSCPYYQELPRAATQSDIRQVVDDFKYAAIAAERTGATLIEIHAAHGYLLSGFLSRATNRRVDAYGGTLANRFRLLHEIMFAVKESVSIPVGVRINVHEQSRAGITVSEVTGGLRPITDLLAYVSVTAGMYTLEGDLIIPRRALGTALWRNEARQIRSSLGLPVFLAGNIEDIGLANEVLEAGDADMALMARSLLADPLIYVKATGRLAAPVQPCTELYLCKYHSRGATNLYCPHNPFLRTPDLLPKVPRS